MPAVGRVLLTNCSGGMGGGEIALLRHIDSSTLPPDRLAVALLNDGPLVTAVRARGVECEVLGRPGRDGLFPGPIESLQISLRLARMVRRFDVRHVVSYTVPDLQAAALIRRLAGFRLCWRSQGEMTIYGRDPARRKEIRRIVRSASRQVDRVATTTEWDREALERSGLPSGLARTFYLGIGENWFGATDTWDRPPREVHRIVMSGRLVPWKGHMTFLRAFMQVSQRMPDLEACIVGGGDDDYRRTLEVEATRLGIGDRTRFLGHLDDTRGLLGASDIAVHCSDREPFGLVLIEAMASGLPVVASDVDGPREIIRHGVNGLLVPPRDVEGFASAIEQILSLPDRGRHMGKAGLETVTARFRAAVNVPAMEGYLFG
jgi:glycosyltransferase involved in cell wall biosynthesis